MIMYAKDDPRAALLDAKSDNRNAVHSEFFGSQMGYFYGRTPQIEEIGTRTWVTRGQNLVIVYSECDAGARLSRTGQPDEYGLILPDLDCAVTITADGEEVDVPGNSVTFVPPGTSEIWVRKACRIVRLFTPLSEDVAALALNAASYSGGHPNVPPFEPWPAPADGYRIRHYTLDVPDVPGRFGRIYRSTNMMINYLTPRHGPRDKRAVSPHHHDDFEQYSLALDGTFTHHLRWPWTTDMTRWKEDEHLFCESPSVCVIPPPSIHTTTAEATGLNQLVDIFAPPRLDFSKKPGWILNADDYPMKEG